ncbi:hypothetical protein NKI88_03190 [Mesorhizobium sp. M0317]|uniref:hypothetical protein n=1 Tax=Mesorhizobium sp. M0317 TaxID=2956935 RepID=UPI00333D55F6
MSEVASTSKRRSVGSKSVAFSALKRVPVGASETIAQRFQQLADSWVRETRFTNSMDDIVSNKSLQQIINLGSVVVPLILKDLEREPKHWFYALQILTGANPVSRNDAGNMQKMAAAWLQWGREKGIEF